MAKVRTAAAAAIVSLALLGCRGSDPANASTDASDTGTPFAFVDNDAGYTGAADAVVEDDAGCGIGTCQALDCSGSWCTWTGALAEECPRNGWSFSRCAGFFGITLQGVDTTSAQYYSADSGELVWSVGCGNHGCGCFGPNPLPCDLFATCIKDDSLCDALEAGTTGDAGDANIEATSSTAGDASAE
jgi:hypothetical protein